MNKKIYISIVLIAISLIFSDTLYADVKCGEAVGEAAINGTDIPSAKAEAIARAKWSAIEQLVGVEVKSQTIVQNMAFVDDAVSREIGGVVKSYDVLSEKKGTDTYTVRIKACVEPAKAEKAVSALARNNSVIVFVPVKKAVSSPTEAQFVETNVLSEAIISGLTESGYTVADLASGQTSDVGMVEQALKSGNLLSLRSLLYKFLANILVIGSADYTVSTEKGADIGYGVKMPFNNITVTLTYRIVYKDANGEMVILSAGSKSDKGMAANINDGIRKGLNKISENITPIIVNKIAEHTKLSVKRVQVKVEGVPDINANFEVKDMLTNISWVNSVEESGIGEFVVKYSENTIYLANSINQKERLKVSKFTPYLITVKYK
ncbi:MAG: hypothetical protein HQK91_03710 [Nitrospirae bacterium]|nr:hypothetical protein [Nitrospirota bacterium]